jgi:hypothetical protein
MWENTFAARTIVGSKRLRDRSFEIVFEDATGARLCLSLPSQDETGRLIPVFLSLVESISPLPDWIHQVAVKEWYVGHSKLEPKVMIRLSKNTHYAVSLDYAKQIVAAIQREIAEIEARPQMTKQ